MYIYWSQCYRTYVSQCLHLTLLFVTFFLCWIIIINVDCGILRSSVSVWPLKNTIAGRCLNCSGISPVTELISTTVWRTPSSVWLVFHSSFILLTLVLLIFCPAVEFYICTFCNNAYVEKVQWSSHGFGYSPVVFRHGTMQTGWSAFLPNAACSWMAPQLLGWEYRHPILSTLGVV